MTIFIEVPPCFSSLLKRDTQLGLLFFLSVERESRGRSVDQAGRKFLEMGRVNTSKGATTLDETDSLIWCMVLKTRSQMRNSCFRKDT